MARIGSSLVLALLWMNLAGCGGDEAGEGTECQPGDSCPCVITADCPDPLTESCNPIAGICQPNGTPEPDADDGTADVETNDVPDVGPPDTDGADDVEEPDGDVQESDADADTDPLPDVPGDADADTSVPPDVEADTDGSSATDADVVDTDTVIPTPGEPLVNPWIAFVSRRVLGSERLWVIRADNTGLTRIATADTVVRDPAWAPDGTELAYVTAEPGRGQSIRIVDVTTGEVRTISPGLNRLANPAWSWDGRWIAFEAQPEGETTSDIFVTAADGTGTASAVAPDGASDSSPLWTLAGEIWFVSGRDSGTNIFRATGADDTNPEAVTDGESIAGRFGVDPLGLRVSFARSTGPSSAQLVVQTLLTGTEVELGTGSDGDPTITADGLNVVFATTRYDAVPDLLMKNAATGLDVRRIAPDPASDGSPAVAPVESDTVDLFWAPEPVVP